MIRFTSFLSGMLAPILSWAAIIIVAALLVFVYTLLLLGLGQIPAIRRRLARRHHFT